MKLEYDSTTLGDDMTGDKIVDHGGDNERIAQVTPLAGGTQPFLAPRGNNSNQRSFTVDKVHTDAKSAVEWWNTHPDELPGSGILRISQDAFAGECSALLTSVNRLALDGKSTLLRYNFITKQITAAA